jgi:RNA ligase (TIGR02306 family)
MAGQLKRFNPEAIGHYADMDITYDVEPLNKNLDAFSPEDDVVVTEKLHGTCHISYYNHLGEFAVSSKGVAKSGCTLVESDTNYYWQVAKAHATKLICQKVLAMYDASHVVVYGEALGIQDLQYGAGKSANKSKYFVFDIKVDGKFLNFDQLIAIRGLVGFPLVPVVYRGLFKYTNPTAMAEGTTLVNGAPTGHIREGVVIKTYIESLDSHNHRKSLKVVGQGYKLRKGDTSEYN